MALQLCCLAMRHYFKDMQQLALDKKSNFDYIEKDVGLHKFLPKVILSSTKPKSIRKLIQSSFKKYAGLSDTDCMIQFLELVKSVFRYEQEKFQCALGVSFVSRFFANISKLILHLSALQHLHSRLTEGGVI